MTKDRLLFLIIHAGDQNQIGESLLSRLRLLCSIESWKRFCHIEHDPDIIDVMTKRLMSAGLSLEEATDFVQKRTFIQTEFRLEYFPSKRKLSCDDRQGVLSFSINDIDFVTYEEIVDTLSEQIAIGYTFTVDDVLYLIQRQGFGNFSVTFFLYGKEVPDETR